MNHLALTCPEAQRALLRWVHAIHDASLDGYAALRVQNELQPSALPLELVVERGDRVDGAYAASCAKLGAVEGIERKEPSAMKTTATAVPVTIGLDIAKWSGPHQTGHAAWLADCGAMNSRGERMRKP